MGNFQEKNVGLLENQGVSDALQAAAEMGGPRSTEPPDVRLAFPLIALPIVLRRCVQEASDAMGVPPECIATPAIATCATAIGNTYRIRLNPSRTEPSVLWAVTLMEGVETPAYHAAIAPLVAEQEEYDASYRYERDFYARAEQLRKADPAKWKAYCDGDNRKLEEPRAVDLLTSKCTVEALATLLANNRRGLALTQDDLSGIFTRLSASKGGSGGGRGGDEYREFYNAGTVKLPRSSGKHLFVPTAALSIFGTCQPSAFRKASGADGSNLVENPLAARFILASPEPTDPRTSRETKPYDTGPYHDLIGKLLAMPLTLDVEDMRAKPAIVSLLPEAQERFNTFVTEHEQQTAAIGNPALRSHYANLVGVAARLALIFYLCDKVTQQIAGPTGVQAQHMLAGIALARWYGREAWRFYEGHESQDQRVQQDLLELIRKHGGTITPRAMGRARQRWVNPEVAERALRDLERAGYGKCVIEPPGPKGGGQSFRFKLFEPGAIDTTPGIPGNYEVVSIAQ